LLLNVYGKGVEVIRGRGEIVREQVRGKMVEKLG
jgi:hypothetical protein